MKSSAIKVIKFIAVIFITALFVGCVDPTPEQLAHGKTFDPHHTHGTVVNLEIKYFQNSTTNYDSGENYFVVTIRNTAGNNDIYYGVDQEIYELLSIDMSLPYTKLILARDLLYLHGKIIDKDSDFVRNLFFIVVDDGFSIKNYQVSIDTFYRYCELDRMLPLEQDEIYKEILP